LQGLHQVAQKLTSTTCPRSELSCTSRPSKSLTVKSITFAGVDVGSAVTAATSTQADNPPASRSSVGITMKRIRRIDQ